MFLQTFHNWKNIYTNVVVLAGLMFGFKAGWVGLLWTKLALFLVVLWSGSWRLFNTHEVKVYGLPH